MSFVKLWRRGTCRERGSSTLLLPCTVQMTSGITRVRLLRSTDKFVYHSSIARGNTRDTIPQIYRVKELSMLGTILQISLQFKRIDISLATCRHM